MSTPIYIPFLTPKDLVQDNQKRLIPGAKICVFDPVSNNSVDIYTYDGANERYVVAENPIYLDGMSRPITSYFSTRLVLCRLYKYVGQLSDPRLSDDDNDWRLVREWNGAFSQNDVQNDTVVNGLEGLENANPELRKVTVVGYWTDDDCEARTYVWNESSVADIDNGYVVGSTESDTGRWILEFDGEWLPSTYYGVYPGHEANINALLSYPAQIGDEKTAPGVYFKPGDYRASSVALVTNKKLLIDNGTSFTRSSITSNSEITVIGGATDHFITDLIGVKRAHSSWYKSLQGFLDSGAEELIFDQSVHFTQSPVMTKNTTLKNVHLVNDTNSYCSYFGFGTYLLTLDHCQVDERLFYPSTSRLYFQNMMVTDRYFYNPSLTNMDISQINADNIYLCNFENAALYLKWRYQQGYTDIDMEGRNVYDIDYAPSLTSLKNCSFNALTLNDSSKSVILRNCNGTLRSANSANMLIDGCNLILDTNLALSSGLLHIQDSVISGSGSIQAGSEFALLIEHSNLEPVITCPVVSSTDTQTYDITVKSSTVSEIEAKKLEMANSRASDVKIYGSAGNAIGNVTLENNVIDDFSFNTVPDYESIVRDCVFVNTRIVNNTFNSSFTCPFYVINSGTLYEFISRTGAHEYFYKGNEGNCPVDYAQLVTTLPYTDGAYQDAEGHTWSLELTNTVRLFMPGDALVKGTLLGSKMVELFTDYSSAQAIHPLNYGLFHAGSVGSQENDYFLMALATDYPALANTVISTIALV